MQYQRLDKIYENRLSSEDDLRGFVISRCRRQAVPRYGLVPRSACGCRGGG
jgi:hypothetical protein